MKKTDKANGKILWLFFGIALTLSVLGTINLASAHSEPNRMHAKGVMHMMMGDMMSGGMTHGNSVELEEMQQHMDKDGDGLCDHCGMHVDACNEMMVSA